MRSGTRIYRVAIGVSFAAAISLGLARFSFALLLPVMRLDLKWSYFLAGGMNTANAAGYLTGALITPYLLRRMSLHTILLIGAGSTTICLSLTASSTEAPVLLLLRCLTGVASAFTFIAGGILTTRLATYEGRNVGLILGLYYSGAGVGIILSAQFLPISISYASAHYQPHPWQTAWITLAILALLLTIVLIKSASLIEIKRDSVTTTSKFKIKDFRYGLISYGLFGVGYIGYMTFIVAFLREQGMANRTIIIFYTLLGVGVCASSLLWRKLLDRYHGGQPMAILNLLLALATAIPLFSRELFSLLISGTLFGSVFLSVVASTTALIRHNLRTPLWAAGISAFTTVFAIGQIIGPVVIGKISDGQGGLERGFIFSLATLLLGALFACFQRTLSGTEKSNSRTND